MSGAQLKDAEPIHEKQGIEMKLKMRHLRILIYNVYRSYQIVKSYSYIMNADKCKSYRDFQMHRSSLFSFKTIIWELANMEDVGNALKLRRSSLTDEDIETLAQSNHIEGQSNSFMLRHNIASRITGNSLIVVFIYDVF